MPRKLACRLAFGVAAGALARIVWPGASADPATLISRVSVVATVLMLTGLPWLARRQFGPVGAGWIQRLVRVTGYATVFALILVKANVERFEFARPVEHPSLAGLWAGEVVFLIVIAAYVAGLLAITSRRPPARTSTLVIGAGAGVIIGLAIYGLRPLADRLHVASPWLGVLYETGKILSVPLILCATLAAAIVAARRISHPNSPRPLTDARARQAVAAGACVGVAAALVVSVLGISTIALVPHVASGLQWTLPGRSTPPGSVYGFEVSITEAAAGYLLVLVIFPLLGAGLGVWGGLYAAGNSGLRPGDGGGGGPRNPEPKPLPPGGGRQLTPEPGPPALDLATLLALPPWDGRAQPTQAPQPAPERPERAPASVP